MSISSEIPKPPAYNLSFDLKTYCGLSQKEQQQIIDYTIPLEEELIWHQSGISNLDLIKGWQQRNLSPKVAADWYFRGYLPFEVDFFLKRSLSAQQADALISSEEKQMIRAQKFPPILLCDVAAWKEYNFTFEEALIWLLNFWVRPDTAREWVDIGFDFPTCQTWWKIGVHQAIIAKAWSDLGLSPEQVQQWKKLVNNANPDWVKQMINLALDPLKDSDCHLIQKLRPSSAIFWLKLDFEWWEIKAWLEANFLAYGIANRWRQAGFSPQEAQKWKIDTDMTAEQAKAWSDLGLTPDNFAGWRKAFGHPQQVRPWLEGNFTLEDAVVWQQTGLKTEETKPWIKAGISPQLALWCHKNYITLDEMLIRLEKNPENLDHLAQ